MGIQTIADNGVDLTPEERVRYGRQIILPQISETGQKKLKTARVLIVGAGGLGSPIALYLAAAGVGTLGIIDFDVVEISNLHRQILHGTKQVGTSKLFSARSRIRDTNPDVNVILHETALTSLNAMNILREYDVIADGTDNFPARYLVNDACVLLGIPNVFGSVFQFEGQASVFDARRGPCYRCIFPDPPLPGASPSCAEAGVLGVLPGIIGTIQASETIKLITGIGESLIGRLLLFNALAMQFRELALKKNPQCPVCSENPVQTQLIDYEEFCNAKTTMDITPNELKQKLDNGENTFILDVREPFEHETANIGGLLIPLSQLPQRFKELDSAREIVVYCHHGNRSQMAAQFLAKQGFSNVRSLSGGIDRWALDIDNTVKRY